MTERTQLLHFHLLCSCSKVANGKKCYFSDLNSPNLLFFSIYMVTPSVWETEDPSQQKSIKYGN